MVSLPESRGAHGPKWDILRTALNLEKEMSPRTTDKEIEILEKLDESLYSSTEFLYSMAPGKKSRKVEFRKMVWDSIFNRKASYEQIRRLMKVIRPEQDTIWKEMFYALEYTEDDVKFGKDLIRAASDVLEIHGKIIPDFDLISFYKELMDDTKDDYYPKTLVGYSEMVALMLQELNSKMLSTSKKYIRKREMYDDGTIDYIMNFLREVLPRQYRNIQRSMNLKKAYRQIIDNVHKLETGVLKEIQDNDREFFEVVYALTEPVKSQSIGYMH